MESNPFWTIVRELYPLFLWAILIYGLIRLGKGILERLQGNKDSIYQALIDIFVAFFFAHMAIPLVYAIWKIMEGVGNRAEEVFKVIF